MQASVRHGAQSQEPPDLVPGYSKTMSQQKIFTQCEQSAVRHVAQGHENSSFPWHTAHEPSWVPWYAQKLQGWSEGGSHTCERTHLHSPHFSRAADSLASGLLVSPAPFAHLSRHFPQPPFERAPDKFRHDGQDDGHRNGAGTFRWCASARLRA